MKRHETPSKIFFADEKLKKAFESLKDSIGKNKQLHEQLSRAFKDLEENAFCGIEIPKKLIPKQYKKYGITNLWKYNMPDAWRLMYSVGNKEIEVISIILEWVDHKNYERRFKY